MNEAEIKSIEGKIIDLGENGYFYVHYEDGKLQAGYVTNTGFVPHYEIEYDEDESLDTNLNKLYDVVLDSIEILDEGIEEEEMEGVKIKGYTDTWYEIDRVTVPNDLDGETTYYLMENEEWGDETCYLVINKDQTEIYETYDDILTCLADEDIIRYDDISKYENDVREQLQEGRKNILQLSADRKTVISCSKDAKGTVKIPRGVTNIYMYAFQGCDGITEIKLPTSLKSIGQMAFNGCEGLTEIDIPDSVTTIESGAFGSCTSLANAHLGEGLTKISHTLFDYCENLVNVEIGKNVVTIGPYAFQGCTELTNIKLPDGVKTIYINAFRDCINLQSIDLGNSLTKIDEQAFYGCDSLKSVTLPQSIEQIGRSAFAECKNLKTLTYEGSEEQWNSVDKGDYWKYKTKIKNIDFSNTNAQEKN